MGNTFEGTLFRRNLPHFMALPESKIPNTKSRFFVELHATNDDVVKDLHHIEDFVDKIGGKK